MLASKYSGMVSSEIRPGHSLTLKVDLDNPSKSPEELLKRCVGRSWTGR